MPRKGSLIFIPIILLLIGWSLSTLGQNTPPDQHANASPFNLLIVDETETFGSSIRVEVLARALKRTGLFGLAAKIVKVPSSFVDPLQGLEPDRQYDVILIVPQGIDEGTIKQIWVVTRPFTEISEELREAVATIKEIAGKIFQGVAVAVGVTDDLVPGYFATLFIREGWL